MSPPLLPPNGEILLYQTEDGHTRIECRFQNETLWLTQALMADLFQTTLPTINEHFKNIFEERELEPRQLFGITEKFATRETERSRGKSSITAWM